MDDVQTQISQAVRRRRPGHVGDMVTIVKVKLNCSVVR